MTLKPCILNLIPFKPGNLKPGILMYNTQTKELDVLSQGKTFMFPYIPVRMNIAFESGIIATEEQIGLLYTEDAEEILQDAWHGHCQVSGGYSYETFKLTCVTDLEFAKIWLFRPYMSNNQHIEMHMGHFNKIIKNNNQCFVEMDNGNPKFVSNKIVLHLDNRCCYHERSELIGKTSKKSCVDCGQLV